MGKCNFITLSLCVMYLLAGLCLQTSAQNTINTATLFRNLYDLETLPLAKDERCRQFSSYDRSGGNWDVANYLSWDRTPDGKGKALLAEMNGPGAIVRIWSAHPDGILKIYLDGNQDPVILTPFDKFFTDPELQPIRTTSSGGWISYWPIPYEKSCRVVVEDTPGFHYHVTYQTYPPNRKVETYTANLSDNATTELNTALKIWRGLDEYYKPASYSLIGTSPVNRTVSNNIALSAGKMGVIFSTKGPGCIDVITLKLPQNIEPIALKRLIIRAYWDDESSPSIESPLLDFFGCGFQESVHSSLPLVVKPGEYICRFPMPFKKSGRIEIANGGDKPVSIEAAIEYRQFDKLNQDALYFHAKWHRTLTVEGVPYTILKASGRGHYVGCTMSMQGQRWLSFLEGDELIYVDGEKEPSVHGTGTEDYFNCGWYFATGLVSQPLHGLTFKTDWDQVGAYRLHIPDYISFSKEIIVNIEHGGENDYPEADYSSTAYFYQSEPHRDFFPPINPAKVNLPRRPYQPVPYSLEAENLKPSASNGKLEMVRWEDITQSWCGTLTPTLVPRTENAAISFTLPVETTDLYRIIGYLAKGNSYGKITCSVDDSPYATVETYVKQDTVPSGPIVLASTLLEKGDHKITLAVDGKNPEGKLPNITVDKFVLESNSQWIRNWMVVGPFALRGLDDADPPETDIYNPDATYQGLNGNVKWQKLTAKRNGFVPLGDLFDLKDVVRVYAVAKIISPDERDTELLLGAVDGVKVYLNGKQIFVIGGWRPAEPDQHRVKVHLKKGENILLMKTLAAKQFGIYARFRDPYSELQYE